MSIASQLERGMASLQRQMPANALITYEGTDYPCIISTLSRGDVLELGGWSDEILLTVHIRKSLMLGGQITVDSTVITVDSDTIIGATGQPQIPFPGKKPVCRNREYRVARVREDGPGVCYILDLVDPTK